eukprot:CAMPEP_0202686502 /NCGR_PEP_ID=MMETSP1385-20130828/2260_1 /ASSEMBLY_ACC=CAM_ASM_000861 /TAXON_ID=933848 /ORGANISM="Elphidium margaritaceum" /LENGTH=429 /DNA_ID=CAMNT_0049341087 /DNA_START=46 /DNA_END=1335 /DNA_ORIENTATION=-
MPSGPESKEESESIELDVSWYPTSTEELHELLTFYRQQSIVYKNERTEYENIMKSLKMSNEQKHKLEWAVHEKTQHNEDLKKQLSDTHILLYHEKNTNIKLSADVKALRAEAAELRQNKEHLLSLLQSANDSIHEMVTDQATNTRSKRCQACNHRQQQKQQKCCIKHAIPQKLTTIYLPHNDTQTLESKLTAKQQELSALKQQYIKINEYLMNDRNLAHESLLALRTQYSDKFESLQTEIEQVSQQHLLNLKEYLSHRRQCKQQLHDMELKVLHIKRENSGMQTKYDGMAQELKSNNLKLEKERKRTSNKLIHGFRMENIRKHEELNEVKHELNALSKSYQCDMKQLKQRLSVTQRKNKRLNKINKCQKIGIQTDVDNLKKKLNDLQKNMNNLCMTDSTAERTQIALRNEIKKVKERLAELANISESQK